jgi:dolichyl-phosphate beta-glucosyltransferase
MSSGQAVSPPRMSPAAPISLSIVIPAFNEAARLPPNLRRVAEYCERLDLAAYGLPEAAYEVLVIVERSSDRTLEESRAAAAALEHIEVIDNQVQRGKGYAVRTGMLRARGELVFFMDADLSTPLQEVEHFLHYFAAHPGVDILIGNRRHPGSHVRRPQGWLRRALSEVFSSLVRRQGLPVVWRDTQCGFKAFRQRAAREIFSRQQLDGFSFDVEVLALAAALHLEVMDLPVDWFDQDATHVRVLRDGWRMLRDLRRVRKLVTASMRAEPAPESQNVRPGLH